MYGYCRVVRVALDVWVLQGGQGCIRCMGTAGWPGVH